MLDAIPESEATPYLYYVLAWPWAQVFGLGEVGLRSLSALVGTAVVPGGLRRGRVARLAAGGAGHGGARRRAPFLVWYSQEARAYSLLALLAAARVLFFARALDGAPATRSPAGRVLLVARARDALLRALPRRCRGALAARALAPTRPALFAAAVPAAVLPLHLPLLLDQRGAGQAVAGASLGPASPGSRRRSSSATASRPSSPGPSSPPRSSLAGLVLLALRAPPEQRRRGLLVGGLAARPARRPGRPRARGQRLRDRAQCDPRDRPRRDLPRNRLRREPARAGRRRRALRPRARDHALRLARRPLRQHRLARRRRAPRAAGGASARSS